MTALHWEKINQKIQDLGVYGCMDVFSLANYNSLANWFEKCCSNRYFKGGTLFRKSFSIPAYYMLLLMFSFRRFNIFGFSLWSSIHLELIFVKSDRYGSNFHSYISGYVDFSAPFVENGAFPPVYVFGIFVKYKMAVVMLTHTWVFCFVPLIYSWG